MSVMNQAALAEQTSSALPDLYTNQFMVRHALDAGIQIQHATRAAAHQAAREARGHTIRRLSPSGASGCMRRAILSTLVEDDQEWDIASLDRFLQGNMYEDHLARILAIAYPYRVSHESLFHPIYQHVMDEWAERGLSMEEMGMPPVYQERRWYGDERWSGYSDIELDAPDNPMRKSDTIPTILECKATGQKWFDYEGGLPKPDHVVQLALYGHFFAQKFNRQARLVLFYLAWTDWAEFVITPRPSHIDISGVLSQKGKVVPRKRTLMISRHELMRDLEYWYDRRQNELPPVLPPEKQEGHCFNKGKVWCPFTHICHPSV